MIQTDSENEFYTMKASLNVHDGRGRPVFVPDNVRLHLPSNFQHSGGDPTAEVPGTDDLCAHPTNPNHHGPTHRALLMALDAWQPVVKVPAAFERRCIPPDGVVRRLRMPDMRPPHALSAGRLAALGATRGSTTGCWADRGVEPPPSRYPRVEDGTLIPLDEYRRRFPRIPGAGMVRFRRPGDS